MTRSADYDRTRKELLSVAAEVFAERGFVGGTTKEIARRVGLTQPAIYHYVNSKEDLLDDIAKDVDIRMLRVLESAFAISEDPAERLASLIKRFTVEVAETPTVFAVFWEELATLPEHLREKIRADQAFFVHKVASLVEQLQQRGQLPRANKFVMAEAILSMPSWMYRWYRPHGEQSPEQIADAFLRLIGLKADMASTSD